MNIEKLAEQMIANGKQGVEVRNGKLYVKGRMIPVVEEGEQPYMSDCPNGVCNI